LNYEKYLEAIGYGKAPEDIMYIDIALELLAVGTLGQGEVLPSWMGFPLSLLGLHIPRPFNVIPEGL
jgi:hypothetical protein